MTREEFLEQQRLKKERFKKRCLNLTIRIEKERGVSPFAKFPHITIPTLFKILKHISPNLHLAKREIIEYKVWDELGERIWWLSDTVNAYNGFLETFELPLYLHK